MGKTYIVRPIVIYIYIYIKPDIHWALLIRIFVENGHKAQICQKKQNDIGIMLKLSFKNSSHKRVFLLEQVLLWGYAFAYLVTKSSCSNGVVRVLFIKRKQLFFFTFQNNQRTSRILFTFDFRIFSYDIQQSFWNNKSFTI